MTLTEFNQNPSRATRLADDGEVIVLRRGEPAYRLTKADAEPTRRRHHPILEEMFRTGEATPAKRYIPPGTKNPFPDLQPLDLPPGYDSTEELRKDRDTGW